MRETDYAHHINTCPSGFTVVSTYGPNSYLFVFNIMCLVNLLSIALFSIQNSRKNKLESVNFKISKIFKWFGASELVVGSGELAVSSATHS